MNSFSIAGSAPRQYKGIDILDGKNYFIWAPKVQMHLQILNYFNLAINTHRPAAGHESLPAWELADLNCKSFLSKVMDDAHNLMYIHYPTAASIWTDLRNRYAQRNAQRGLLHLEDLRNIRMNSHETLLDYFARIRILQCHCLHAGRDVPEVDAVFYALRGITKPVYQDAIRVLRFQRNISLSDAEQFLLEEISSDPSQLNSRQSTFDAFATTSSTSTKRNARPNRNKSSTYDNRDLPTNQGNRRSVPKSFCSIHGYCAHTTADCRAQKPQQHESTTQFSSSTYRNRTKPPKNGQDSRKHSASLTSTVNSVSMADYTHSPQETQQAFVVKIPTPQHCALTATAATTKQAEITKLPCRAEPDDEWTVDSGASTHLTSCFKWLKDPRPIAVKICLAGKDTSMFATHCGNVQLLTDYCAITLHDVLYCPNLTGNLLSVHRLAKANVDSHFTKLGGTFTTPHGEIIATARIKGSFYIWNSRHHPQAFTTPCTPIPDAESLPHRMTDAMARLTSTDADWEMLHRRLGHPSQRRMVQLVRFGLLRDIKLTIGKLAPCDVCSRAKAQRLPFSGQHAITTSRPITTLLIDLCGPMRTPSLLGNKYVMVIVDEFSRKYFTIFLPDRTQAPVKILEFIAQKERELALRVVSIVTDNARELIAAPFERQLQQWGIKHRRAAAWSPQGNAIAERAIGALTRHARCLMIDASLPDPFWEFAYRMAAFLHNVSPCSSLPAATSPMIRWNGRVPTYKHHRIFGCLVHYALPPPQRGEKFNATGRRGIFLGHIPQRGGQIVYDLNTHKVIVTRNIRYTETVKGATFLMQPSSSMPSQHPVQQSYDSDSDSDDDSKPPPQPPVPPKPPPDNLPDPPIEPTPTKRKRGRPKGTTKAVMAERRRQQAAQTASQMTQNNTPSEEQLESDYSTLQIEPLQCTPSSDDDNYLCMKCSTASEDLTGKNVPCNVNEPLPRTYHEAMHSADAIHWQTAMKSELQSLESHDVWSLVPRPVKVKIIPTKWIFTRKFNPDGHF